MATTDIKPGDCFFNVKRQSCLRVRTVGGKWADAVTWRPNGTRGSNIVSVKIESLTKAPYQRMNSVGVYTDSDYYEFDLTEPAPICPQIDQSLAEEIEEKWERKAGGHFDA